MNLRRGDKIIVDYYGHAVVAIVRKTGQQIRCALTEVDWLGTVYPATAKPLQHYHVRKRDEGRTWARDNTVDGAALRAFIALRSP